MAKVYVFDHPLIQHKITFIRDKNTGTKEFRELVDEVATLMMFEITRDMTLEEVEVETPVSTAKSKVIAGKKIGIVPILRAGIGMVDGILIWQMYYLHPHMVFTLANVVFTPAHGFLLSGM